MEQHTWLVVACGVGLCGEEARPGPLSSSTFNEFVATSASSPHLLMWGCSHSAEGAWGTWVPLSQALLGERGTQLHLLKTVGQTPSPGLVPPLVAGTSFPGQGRAEGQDCSAPQECDRGPVALGS